MPQKTKVPIYQGEWRKTRSGWPREVPGLPDSEPEGPTVLHSLRHASRHRGDPTLQSSFPTCALDMQPASVCSGGLFFQFAPLPPAAPFLQEQHQKSITFPFRSCCLNNQSLLQTFLCCGIYSLILLLLFRQIFSLEPRLAWNSLSSSGLECFLE